MSSQENMPNELTDEQMRLIATSNRIDLAIATIEKCKYLLISLPPATDEEGKQTRDATLGYVRDVFAQSIDWAIQSTQEKEESKIITPKGPRIIR